MGREKTKVILNQAVADLSQFAAVIHQAHWYMRGERFLTMHPKMDEFMDEINEHLDEIAERLITIGGAPYSTLSEFAANTKITDKTGDFNLTIDDHLRTLLAGYRYILTLYQQGIDTAAEENDAVTEDMFTGLLAVIEKNIWMISATLGEAAKL